jgi:hypothetical protein
MPQIGDVMNTSELQIKTSCNLLAWTQNTGLCTVERDGSCSKYVPVKEDHIPQPGFKCSVCGTLGHKPAIVPVKIRDKVYTEMGLDMYGNPVEVVTGEGFETVKEAMLCQRCDCIRRGTIKPEGN